MIDFDTLVIGPCMAVFAEPVTFTAKNRLPQAVTGVFDRAYLELQPLGGGPQEPPRFGGAGNVTARRPVLGVQLSQFIHQPQQGDRIDLPSRSLAYTIQEVQPDGQGGAKLLLTKLT